MKAFQTDKTDTEGAREMKDFLQVALDNGYGEDGKIKNGVEVCLRVTRFCAQRSTNLR